MNKIKLLYIPQHLSCGGMPQFLLKRIQSLLSYTDSFDIYVIEYNNYGKLFPTQRNQIVEILGDKFYSLGDNKMKALDIINEIKPDIIHLDEMPELMNNDELFKKLYQNDRKWYIVETCHNSSFRPDTDKRFHPDLYSFCTSWHEEIFGNMDAQFVTIPYPIEESPVTISDTYRDIVRKDLGFEKNKKHIINIGIWTEGKNQAEGIEIARKYPEIIFHFIGAMAGNFQYYWEPLIKDLPSNVKIWGEQDDIFRFLIAADIFMFNSTLELNPLVLREAIGYELPIIARNLPQYAGMYDEYINPIDTDLSTLKCTYNVPTDCTSSIFAFRHKEAYKKTLELPIHKQSVRVINHYVDNPYLEIIGISDSDYKVQFLDENGSIAYEKTIKSNHWVKLNRQYYTNWTAKVFDGDEMIYANTLNLNGKRVYIAFESKSLGDTLAWMPYAEEFRKKHNCKVIVSSFWNKLLDYPEIEFVEPATIVKNIYALYRLGYFYDINKLPFKPQTIPLQKVATAILGLDYEEVIPKLAYTPKVPKIGKYVTIATNSTAGMKFWSKEQWQLTINWLVSEGYEVFNVSAEPNPFDNCTQITTPSLESKMDWIAHSEFFIGLGSGLSWVAWALKKKVFMIANFSEDWAEFKTNCIKITNKSVCNGCWNNPNFKFDGSWEYCPVHKGSDRQWECQLSITADMVIEEIKKASV
jgi:autotransporter strand-loop-strand O-heptosyltransferase